MNRRRFLATTALTSAALSLPYTFRAEQPKSPLRLGLCSYTFRNFTRAQLIAFMKQLNLTELNAKDIKDHLPSTSPEEEAKALADYRSAGIHLHAAGAIYFPKNEDADIRAKFEYCKRAGINVIVGGDPTPETLPRLERFVREYDIRLAIHNHGPEDKLWASPLDILKDIKSLDPRIGCCIDVGHTARTGTDVVEAIRQVGPRLFNVHMKDLADPRVKESQVAVGDGALPIPQIFRALTDINYQGFVDLEYEIHAEDPMPGVITSFSYMRGVLAGMNFAKS